MRRLAVVAFLALLVVAPLAAAPVAGDEAATPPADPPSDRLGWEAGYWHNESIDVTPDDGLNDTELDRVVARSMARVEYVRGIEFDREVPVEVISRDEYAANVSDDFENVSTGNRLHQNVKFEALFMLGESESAVGSQEQTTAASVGGYYDPGEDRIVVVSENATTPRLNEITLAQELFHALQYRHFPVENYTMHTREAHNAHDGIVEGDGNYVDYLYEQRCGDLWNGTCLEPSADGSGGGSGGDPHAGLLYLRYQPYSDGPPFVQSIREAGGWDAVDAVYEDPPASTEQTIHPETYGVDEPTNVSVPDRSTADWDKPETGGVTYASFGEAGLYMMFWYPGYESSLATQIVPYRSFLNFAPSESIPAIDPFNYTSRYSAGWDGDRLVPYATDDSAETNETGYVWKLAWDSPAEAREFVDGYRRLLAYHGAEQVGVSTWRVPSGGYADALHVNTTGDTVVVTNAPTVDALSDVRSSVTVDRAGLPTETPTAGPETTDTEAPGLPGFGVGAALLAAALLAMRRQ